jgi:hypothetical protein
MSSAPSPGGEGWDEREQLFATKRHHLIRQKKSVGHPLKLNSVPHHQPKDTHETTRSIPKSVAAPPELPTGARIDVPIRRQNESPRSLPWQSPGENVLPKAHLNLTIAMAVPSLLVSL